MNTSTKITVAKGASRVVRIIRRLLGMSEIVRCRRRGILWELDLKQGIDLSIYLFGAFEPEIVDYASHIIKPGAKVLDIGANIGAHTMRLAHLVGPSGAVFAFEPTDYAFEKLLRHIQLNPNLKNRIHAFQEILASSSEENKPQAICSSWPLDSNAEVHAVHQGEAMSLNAAGVTTLDIAAEQQGWKSIDLVKMDVDGNELFVLQGGKNFFRRFHPPILMEFAPYLYQEHGYSLKDLVDFLSAMNYRCQLLPSQKEIDFSELPSIISEGGSLNVLLT